MAFPGKSDESVVAARAISASDVWAFTASLNQSRVLRWDGRILALSSHNVYAIANGFRQDEGGPMALLNWDGHRWSRVAGGNYGFGSQPLQQMSSDGRGGLLQYEV